MFTRVSLVIIALLFLSPSILFSQTNYGNEWIRSYQPYYKIKVFADGVYKITANDLQQAGINLNTVSPERIQMVYKGLEIPIFVQGEADGNFDNNDWIEFIGRKNDGSMDTRLFENPAWHANPYYSMISDTSAYFLTILPDTTVINPLRYRNLQTVAYNSYSAEAYFIDEPVFSGTTEYYPGEPLDPDDNFHTPKYYKGEGWAAQRFGPGNPTLTYSLNTPNYYSSGPLPFAEILLLGLSDPPVIVDDHSVNITNNIRTIADVINQGHKMLRLNYTLQPTDIGNQTDFKFKTNTASGSDFNAVSFIKIKYPRSFELQQNPQLKFRHKALTVSDSIRLSFTNFGSSFYNQPMLFVEEMNLRIRASIAGNNAEFLVPMEGDTFNYFMIDGSLLKSVAGISKVDFDLINAAQNYQYLIITHEKLLGPATAYHNYRSQRFKTLTVTSNELYDQFNYGFVHPIAIRNFASYLVNQSVEAPQYLMLLGRGYQNDLLKKPGIYNLNLVPSIGVPSSDNMFTAGLGKSESMAGIPTGRIAAEKDDDINNYLQKLIKYETGPDSIQEWRKEVLHLGGGLPNQQSGFQEILNEQEAIVESDKLGGNVRKFYKSVNTVVETNLKQKIVDKIDSGVHLMTFLGHGSLSILDIDIGQVNDLKGTNKFPVFYFNGCNVGNVNSEFLVPTGGIGISGSEYMSKFTDRGPIAWIAHSNTSYDGLLYRQIRQFYKAAYIDHYGESLGKILGTLDSVQDPGDETMAAHNLALIFQGDPAVRLYSPPQADIKLGKEDIYIYPDKVSSNSDSFAVAIIITNLGKTYDDSVVISVTRTLPNNTILSLPEMKVEPIKLKDTIYYWIRSKDPATRGNNRFQVVIDQPNIIQEMNEDNNSASLNFFMPGNGLNILFPAPFSIVNSNQVALTVQANDLFSRNNEFIFEVDTNPDFPFSPFYKRTLINAHQIAEWKVDLTAPDSMVFYWRAKLNLPDSQGGYWQNASFTYIPGSPEGWSQSHIFQFTGNSFKDLILNLNSRSTEFLPFSQNIQLSNRRWLFANQGIKTETSQFLTPGAGSCISEGLLVVVFDKKTLEPTLSPNLPIPCPAQIVPDRKYYTFNTNIQSGRDEFQTFVDSLEDGVYVAIVNRYGYSPDIWDENTYKAFEKLGSSLIRDIDNNSTALVFLGKKGGPIGTAYEDTVINFRFNTIGNPGDTFFVRLNAAISGILPNGAFSSETIGPARSWNKLFYKFKSIESPSTDLAFINVFAIDRFGKDTLVIAGIQNDSADLSFIDASRFPFLKLHAVISDDINRTPPQLDHWTVLFEGVPEGTLAPEVQFAFHNTTLDQGDSLSIDLAFRNISSRTFDSLLVEYRITNTNRVEKVFIRERLKGLGIGDTVRFSKVFSTRQLDGLHNFSVLVNPEYDQPEQTLINNSYGTSFTVKADKTNPLLDVTFDGVHIMNGDIVSPTPFILISSKDDSKFLLQNDTSRFELTLKNPNGTIKKLSFINPDLKFIPATGTQNKAKIEYKPARLEDGIYTLTVNGKDASGNISGEKPYSIEFNVINESSITNFFPYPNPFTTQMRFVFTLTGEHLPEDLKIQIMTVSGKIVREVFLDEFGSVHVGNNISDFVWDGTDMFGDRLANGVYLYRVVTRLNGAEIKKRETSADHFFTKQFGKIYMMR